MAVVLNHHVDGPPAAHPLVLLGSLGSTLDMWSPNLPGLTEVARVIRLDLPGHGDSPVPAGPYTVAGIARDVLCTVDSLGVDTFDWGGLSLGGMVGMFLATEHADRVRRLTLCSTSAGFADRSTWAKRLEDVGRHGTEGLASAIVTRWFTHEWAKGHPRELERARSWVAGTPVHGYSSCCQAIHDWDHRDRVAEITAPTLVLVGKDDPITPAEPHTRLLADRIRDAEVVEVPGSHLINIESAHVINPLLVSHLSGT